MTEDEFECFMENHGNIYFAGDAFIQHPFTRYVCSAYYSGINTALRILDDIYAGFMLHRYTNIKQHLDEFSDIKQTKNKNLR